MKTKRPYKPRAKRSPDKQLLKDAHDVMKEVIEAWEVPDSPEGFCFAMKSVMVIRDRIAARLEITG
jgi:hypothetical protein